MIEFGMIGNGVHSKRIQKILRKKCFIYKPIGNEEIDRKNFEIFFKKKKKKKNYFYMLTKSYTF